MVGPSADIRNQWLPILDDCFFRLHATWRNASRLRLQVSMTSASAKAPSQRVTDKLKHRGLGYSGRWL